VCLHSAADGTERAWHNEAPQLHRLVTKGRAMTADQDQSTRRAMPEARVSVEDPRAAADRAGPAQVVEQRSRTTTIVGGRGYPALVPPLDPTGSAVILAATRALLTAETRGQVASVLHTAVSDLGGSVVAVRSAGADALPVDVSLGVGEPRVVTVDPVHPSSLLLITHLPTLVEDALTSAARCDGDRRRPVRVTLDAATGVGNRAVVGPRLGEAVVGDVVCLVDIDDFKALNDALGLSGADRALRRCGTLLRTHVRSPYDFVGRWGADKFLVILAGAPLEVACDRLRQVALAWMAEHRASVSIGVAVCTELGGGAARKAAEQALRRAKESGRNRLAVATAEDHADAAI
jgi:diguanylate cyclase (GGDEF)-like protein